MCMNLVNTLINGTFVLRHDLDSAEHNFLCYFCLEFTSQGQSWTCTKSQCF